MAQSDEIVGTPRIVSGDSLDVRGYRLRLFGIDAPELGQVCMRDGSAYDCGRIAATALMDLTAGIAVRCLPKHRMNETLVAECYASDYDLSEGMVYTGWALALPDEGRRYEGLENGAKKARRGLWGGEFIAPWEWRLGKRLAGSNQ
jgi:endonuclease YncB( thermonuclease family)